MDKKYFQRLLTKYAAGKASQEEERFLQAYYNLFESEPDVIEKLTVEQQLVLQEEIKGDIWKGVDAEEGRPARDKVRSLWIWRGAVAAVFILICSVAFLWLSPSATSDAAMLAVHNNKKTERTIILPDGSTVVLGADSRINYPRSFDDMDKREVFLVGNAFFDITHSPSRPFIVRSEKVETVVLGTAFTIEAYPWEKEITVTVKRGKVRVSDENKVQGIITPDQQIIYDKSKKVSVQEKVNSAHYEEWKAGSLLFANVTLPEAAIILEKKFRVRVLVSNKDTTLKRFTASFNVADPLEMVLKSICEFNEVPYSYDKGKALVKIGAL